MLIFIVKFNLEVQISWMPCLFTRETTQSHVERAYIDCFTIPAVSQSPSSAHIYLPRPLHGPDCFTVSTLCIYTDLGSRGYSGIQCRSCILKGSLLEEILWWILTFLVKFPDYHGYRYQVSSSRKQGLYGKTGRLLSSIVKEGFQLPMAFRKNEVNWLLFADINQEIGKKWFTCSEIWKSGCFPQDADAHPAGRPNHVQILWVIALLVIVCSKQNTRRFRSQSWVSCRAYGLT